MRTPGISAYRSLAFAVSAQHSDHSTAIKLRFARVYQVEPVPYDLAAPAVRQDSHQHGGSQNVALCWAVDEVTVLVPRI